MKNLDKFIQANENSVLCYLATINKDGSPNLSVKELFVYKDNSILIANIASPQS